MITKRFPGIPRLFLYSLVLLLPCALMCVTRIVGAASYRGGDSPLVLSGLTSAGVPIPSPTPVRVPVPGLGVRVAVELLAPIEPVSALGSKTLFYELRLTNYDPRDLLLKRLEVLDGGAEGSVIARYSGKELEGMVATNPWGTKTPYLLTRGAQSVVFFSISLKPGKAAPARIRHRFVFEGETGKGRGDLELISRPVPVTHKEPAVFSPPVRGRYWYAHSGPANNTHHRRTLAPREGMLTMDQRFGIDFFLLNRRENNGRTFFVPDWKRTLGTEIVSVAPGEVVKVVDGLPEEPFDTKTNEGIEVNWDTIGGNLVVVKTGENQFVWFEHLKTGSIVVKVGDKVRAGQKIAKLGTSGNAGGAPHLHFEYTDSMVLGTGNGIPYVFSCFEMPSILEDFPDWDELIQKDPLKLGTASGRLRQINGKTRRMEIPLAGSIMSFSESGRCGT